MKKIKKDIRVSFRANQDLIDAINRIKDLYEDLNKLNPNTEPYHPTTTDVIEEAIYNLADFYDQTAEKINEYKNQKS